VGSSVTAGQREREKGRKREKGPQAPKIVSRKRLRGSRLMDPYRFQRRIDAEKKIEELKAALNSSDVGKKDEALKQELNMLRAEVEALKKEVSISTPPPAGNAISHRDAQLLQWLKALRTILSNKVGNMKSWVLRFDQNSDGKIDKGEFKGLLQTY